MEIRRKDGPPIEVDRLLDSGTGQDVYVDEVGKKVLKIAKPWKALWASTRLIQTCDSDFDAVHFCDTILKITEATGKVTFPEEWSVEPNLVLDKDNDNKMQETVAFWQTYYRNLIDGEFSHPLPLYSYNKRTDHPFFQVQNNSHEQNTEYIFLDWDKFLSEMMRSYELGGLSLDQICEQIHEWGEEKN